MDQVLELLQAKDTKERMAGVERLQTLLEQSRKPLTATEVANLVDASLVLLKDNNFRVSQGSLQALASAAALASEHFKLHFNALLPAVVERLGDSKQPVRDAGRRLLLALMEISSPTIVVERAGSYAWIHKNWKVREEFARTVTSAINLFAATELPLQRLLLPSVLQLLEDSNSNAREAAMACLEAMYQQGGSQFRDELQRQQLRPAQLKEIIFRFEKIEPKIRSFDGIGSHFTTLDTRSSTNSITGSSHRSSPKAKPVMPHISTLGGENEIVEKPGEPIRVFSERELTKELEKVAGLLTPDQDWSVRMAAMQKVEGLVFGGAAQYACFPSLLKQLVGPINLQLSDRRSSIVKQACHLLSLLSKELLADFEPCAEVFIPVLFKLVVITVMVIAESADTCIKTMLRNCRVARVLPRIVECAKSDRNSVLRTRCCEYALLVLEQWSDSPEIQRLTDLYEDLIKCCIGDAMSEVRFTSRMCYRVFAKCWPDRGRQLFSSFDSAIQRLIHEEEGGIHKRYSSPLLRDRAVYQTRHSSSLPTNSGTHTTATGWQLASFSTSPIVAMDRTKSLHSGTNTATTESLLMVQRKPTERLSERSLESVLQASQQSVDAIETMLKGMDTTEKGNLFMAAHMNGKDQAVGSYRHIHAAHVGLNSLSPSDSAQPVVSTVSSQRVSQEAIASIAPNNLDRVPSGGAVIGSSESTAIMEVPLSEETKGDVFKKCNVDHSPRLLYSMKRVPTALDRLTSIPNDEGCEGRFMKHMPQLEKSATDILFRDFAHKDSPHNSLPGFQRPLLRTCNSLRSSASSRSSVEDSQLPFGEGYSYMDGLMSLNDVLAEGLSANADWSARVSAFNYLRNLLQQGTKGIQEINQNFEKVMKLFSQHLDDPHHKVAQSALKTLVELVPLCRKPFEAYLERILPRIFSRLIDPKELIRQLGTSALEIVGNSYSIDTLLPALLRSLDEQRSPKARMAVIEFAIAAFARLAINGEVAAGSNLLKLWLAKLAPLANDKNSKLKETAVSGIISVYSHFDSTTVLNFIVGLSIEEQSSLRRALKQYTPRIEVDLINILQSKGQRTRPKSMHDRSDASVLAMDNGNATSSGGVNLASSLKNGFLGGYSSGSLNSDSLRNWSANNPEANQYGYKISGQTTVEERHKPYYQDFDNAYAVDDSLVCAKVKDHRNGMDSSPDRSQSWSDQGLRTFHSRKARNDYKNVSSPRMSTDVLTNHEQQVSGTGEGTHSNELQLDGEGKLGKDTYTKSKKMSLSYELSSSIPTLLNQLCSGNDDKAADKKLEALQEFIRISEANDASVWTQYLNQILTAVLEVLDDSNSTVREFALSTILQMLTAQKDILEDSVEMLLEKLIYSTKDIVAKVSDVADRCLTTVLMQHNPYRCLSVVVPLLVSENEKTLVTCINCLTKIVSRLPPEELMAQLPLFLPALFDAFGNQSADVRKTVVFCLVDIYIVLGKAFLPYLGSLSSTQLRLVTIYANRISQARSGTALDPTSL